MNVELLATKLAAYSEQDDWKQDLVVRAGPGGDLFFRFSGSEVDGGRVMTWEARPAAAGRGDVKPGPDIWLTRMGFQRDGECILSRTIALPVTIEDARLIASAVVFLLRRVHGIVPDHQVSATLEVRPPHLPQLAC